MTSPSAGRRTGDPPPPTLPPPLVTFSGDPLKWVQNKAELLIVALILAHIGTLIVVALYYLLFEVNSATTSWWHRAVSDSTLRHHIRGVAEGLLGGFLAQQVVWNHYRKRLNKPPTTLDKAEMALRIPNVHDSRRLSIGEVVVAPLFALLYAVPGFIAGYLIVKWAQSQPGHLPHALSTVAHAPSRATSLMDRTRTIWTQNWPQKAIGLGASLFFGRRPVRGVFDDVQLWFVERRVAIHKPVRWYHPPTFKARYNSVTREDAHVADDQGFLATALMLSLVAVGGALAAYGWYVLAFIAQ